MELNNHEKIKFSLIFVIFFLLGAMLTALIYEHNVEVCMDSRIELIEKYNEDCLKIKDYEVNINGSNRFWGAGSEYKTN